MGEGLGAFLAHPAFQHLPAYLEMPGATGTARTPTRSGSCASCTRAGRRRRSRARDAATRRASKLRTSTRGRGVTERASGGVEADMTELRARPPSATWTTSTATSPGSPATGSSPRTSPARRSSARCASGTASIRSAARRAPGSARSRAPSRSTTSAPSAGARGARSSRRVPERVRGAARRGLLARARGRRCAG